MTDSLSHLLTAHGYSPETGSRLDLAADLSRAATLLGTDQPDLGPLLMPLLDQGVIRASGPDAADFLQNLLTNDVKNLPAQETRLAGFCTPKGRLLALFHIWRDAAIEGDMLLMLPRELLPAMLKKLSMYVLRSKVKLTDATGELALLGWALPGVTDRTDGSDATGAIAVSPAPTWAGMHTLRLTRSGTPALGLLVAPLSPEASVAQWEQALPAKSQWLGLPVWHWLQIAAGVPQVLAATQEAFVPQMLNMELLAVAGISFSKGCYPGQEIVARTQYLGKIKRRMFRARLQRPAHPGDPVFAPETGDQPCGSLVSVAQAPEGMIEALVCVQSAAVEAGEIHVGALDGPTLTVLSLPYALDGPDTRQR